ncbi:Hypothetical predicted protein [Cloeon dipterum]|uniref:Uncharacterized protein n=1 Tax=Cloeon dipterum TaxID=197152 RepID=A0A8S1BN41_9INSE|nr:Hypothetical predicted protein [Cloeon dipterum]
MIASDYIGNVPVRRRHRSRVQPSQPQRATPQHFRDCANGVLLMLCGWRTACRGSQSSSSSGGAMPCSWRAMLKKNVGRAAIESNRRHREPRKASATAAAAESEEETPETRGVVASAAARCRWAH